MASRAGCHVAGTWRFACNVHKHAILQPSRDGLEPWSLPPTCEQPSAIPESHDYGAARGSDVPNAGEQRSAATRGLHQTSSRRTSPWY